MRCADVLSRKYLHGFTTIELITVMVILGILAVVALPRLNNADEKALVFRDQTEAALRYAQKSAVSHRRTTCVTFSASSVTLQIASTTTPTTAPAGNTLCDSNLPLPGQNGNVVTSGDVINATFTSLPTAFRFTPEGLAYSQVQPNTQLSQTITVNGVNEAINVVGTTGYVGD
jgi:prepilin-type N-terminal cleavage/methylation domain-containing protein